MQIVSDDDVKKHFGYECGHCGVVLSAPDEQEFIKVDWPETDKGTNTGKIRCLCIKCYCEERELDERKHELTNYDLELYSRYVDK